MYGTNVPTFFAAGIPGAVVPFTLGAPQLMWIALATVTAATLTGTLLRLIPRKGA